VQRGQTPLMDYPVRRFGLISTQGQQPDNI
jgi:hypothetical protein